jgi:glutamine amidotransferase
MKTVIIKYNAGNTQSVLFALERIGINAVVTDNVDILKSADKIIFPGVGEASSAMKYLQERKLNEVIVNLRQHVLGICLGMQLMCSYSEEGNTNCLGIFNQEVKMFLPQGLKVPQIGWNNISNLRTDLFTGVQEKDHQYFVHSYYVEKGNSTVATTNYGIDYSAALHKNNFYGVQFHPEKSGTVGQKILENFIKL